MDESNDPVRPFREPVVAATGILLGFILNFAASWVKEEGLMPVWLACLVGAFVLAGVVLLVNVLYRALRMDYPREQAAQWYAGTLRRFILGVGLSFIGAFIDMFSHFWAD